MTRQITVTCDRCSATGAGEYHATTRRISNPTGWRYMTRDTDLCPACNDEFEAWRTKADTAPVAEPPVEPALPFPGQQCQRCDGCGKVADSDDGEPWTAWMKLPVGSAAAVIAGLVKPVDCPDCSGTGVQA
jgi:hypothetical protein